jgi:hypothetical protein
VQAPYGAINTTRRGLSSYQSQRLATRNMASTTMSTAPTAKSVTNAKGTTYLLPPPSKSDAPSRTLGQRNGDLIPAYAIGGVSPKQLPRTPYWRTSQNIPSTYFGE